MKNAPKPPNFAAMVDAWNRPEEFAALVHSYYALIGAQRAEGARDITEPLHRKEPE